jgi:hypothetical protein
VALHHEEARSISTGRIANVRQFSSSWLDGLNVGLPNGAPADCTSSPPSLGHSLGARREYRMDPLAPQGAILPHSRMAKCLCYSSVCTRAASRAVVFALTVDFITGFRQSSLEF